MPASNVDKNEEKAQDDSNITQILPKHIIVVLVCDSLADLQHVQLLREHTVYQATTKKKKEAKNKEWMCHFACNIKQDQMFGWQITFSNCSTYCLELYYEI